MTLQGCSLLDNAGAIVLMMAKAMWYMDVPLLLLLRRYCTACRITFDVAAPRDSKGFQGLNLGIVRLAPSFLGVVATATNNLNLLSPI
jgi:hypothetical protein